jgi:ATP-dependent protease ClpP protease subunit
MPNGNKKNWYSMKAKDGDASTVEVLIYDEIGYWGVRAKDFIRDLQALAAKAKSIVVAVNSPGGDVFDAFAIYNALRRYEGKVTCRVDAVAASAASLVIMAGDKIVMPDNAMIMIHNVWTWAVGTADDLRDLADVMDKMRDGIVAAYARKSGQDAAKLIEMMDAETWLTALEAHALGLCDVIEDPVRLAASASSRGMLAKYGHAPAGLLASLEEGEADETDADPAETGTEGQETGTGAGEADPALAAEDPAPTPTAQVGRIFQACREAGIANLAEAILMSTDLNDPNAAEAALARATAIQQLCLAARLPELAADYVKSGISADAVRARLFDRLHGMDVGNIDNSQPTGDAKPTKAKAKTPDHGKIYASRKGGRKTPAKTATQ